MSDEVEYIELHQRSHADAILNASMTITRLMLEAEEVRSLLGLRRGSTHAEAVRHLHAVRAQIAESQRVAVRLTTLTGQ